MARGRSKWCGCGHSSCLTPYILRLVFIVLPKAGQEWLWQRDCKHKSARPTTNAAIESIEREARK